MKKLFLLIIILFIVSGCIRKTSIMTEENALEIMSSYNESGVVERINDINKGLTPKLKPSKKSSASSETAGENQIQLEDLASRVSQAVIKTNFGDMVSGMDVIEKIEAVEINKNDHPLQDVIIESIEFIGD